MDEQTENAWRKALKVRGRDWVMAQLHAKPGHPDDTLYDVVFEEPYPTRQFCLQWCATEENKVFRMSWHNYAAILAMILFIICSFKAIQSWNQATFEATRAQGTMAGAGKKAKGGTSQQANGQSQSSMSNDIPTYQQSSGTDSSASATSVSGPLMSGQSGVPGRSPLTSEQSGVAGGATPSQLSICAYATYASTRCPMQN